jgi:hypothetical protein
MLPQQTEGSAPAGRTRRRTERDDVFARARRIARFYTGRQHITATAVAVVLDRLDEVELRLANARTALNGRRAS